MERQIGIEKENQPQSRRNFLKTAGLVALTTIVSPTILRAADKTGRSDLIIGTGAYRYEVHHHWAKLPISLVGRQPTMLPSTQKDYSTLSMKDESINLITHLFLFLTNKESTSVLLATSSKEEATDLRSERKEVNSFCMFALINR